MYLRVITERIRDARSSRRHWRYRKYRKAEVFGREGRREMSECDEETGGFERDTNVLDHPDAEGRGFN